MNARTAEDIYALVQQLPATERLRLVERIAHDLSQPRPAELEYDWARLAGVAPGLLEGHDAQAWVTSSRKQGDAGRDPHPSRKP